MTGHFPGIDAIINYAVYAETVTSPHLIYRERLATKKLATELNTDE